MHSGEATTDLGREGISLPHVHHYLKTEDEDEEEAVAASTTIRTPILPGTESSNQALMTFLADNLVHSHRYDLLKLVFFTVGEVHHLQYPWLQNRQISDLKLKEWEETNTEIWSDMLERQLIANTDKSNETLKSIPKRIEAAFRKISAEIFSDKTAHRLNMWQTISTNGVQKTDTKAAKKYFDVAVSAFLAWKQHQFDSIFDDHKSYEVNRENCIRLIANRERVRISRPKTIIERKTLQNSTLESCEKPIAKLIKEIDEFVSEHSPPYPFYFSNLKLLDAIDADGNTFIHILLKNQLPQYLRQFIHYLPLYLERERLEDPKKEISFETFKAIKNKAGESIGDLIKRYDSRRMSAASSVTDPKPSSTKIQSIETLIKAQWKIGVYTGHPIKPNAIKPIANAMNLAYPITLEKSRWYILEPHDYEAAEEGTPTSRSRSAPSHSGTAPIPIPAKRSASTSTARRSDDRKEVKISIDLKSSPADDYFDRPETPIRITKRQALLKEFALANGFTSRSVAGDGNCFFAAIAALLNHNNHSYLTHQEVRAASIAYLTIHKELHHGFADSKDLEDYLNRMAKADTWAEEHILEATARCYNIRIHITDLRENGDTYYITINETAVSSPLYSLALTGFELGLGHYHPLISNAHSATVDGDSPAAGGAGAIASTSMIAVTPASETEMEMELETDNSMQGLFNKMMRDVAFWNSELPSTETSLPYTVSEKNIYRARIALPYNTPEKRAHLAMWAVDRNNKLLLSHLLTEGTTDPEVLRARALHTPQVEIEYPDYLLDLWRANMSLQYFKLIHQGLLSLERATTPITFIELIAIRTQALSKLSTMALEQFFTMDQEHCSHWTQLDAKGVLQRDNRIIPVLEAHIALFSLWEQTSEYRVINENKIFGLDCVRVDLKDLYRMIHLKSMELKALEDQHSPEVTLFYRQVQYLLMRPTYKNLLPFKVDSSKKNIIMACASIFGQPQSLTELIDIYGNTLLHRAFLGNVQDISDWLLWRVMPDCSDKTHPIMKQSNKLGQTPTDIAEVFRDIRNLHVLHEALLEIERNASKKDGSAEKSTFVRGLINEKEIELFNTIKYVMHRIPELCRCLIAINNFLKMYESQVLKRKREEKISYDRGDFTDLLVVIKWKLASLCGQDQGLILTHRDAAIRKLASFKEWVAKSIQDLTKKSSEELPSSFIKEVKENAEILNTDKPFEGLPNHFIEDIMENAAKLNSDIDDILTAPGITYGRFRENLLSIKAVLNAVGHKKVRLTTQLMEQANAVVPKDKETGSPLFHPAVHSSALEIALANALKESTRKLTEEKEKTDTRDKKHAKEMEELKAEFAEERATTQAKMERMERIMLEILAQPGRPALVFGSINATDHSHDEVSHGASSRAAAGGAGHD